MKLTKALVNLTALLSFSPAFAQAQPKAGQEPLLVQQLRAVALEVYQTTEARQGAAAIRHHIYAIDNRTIAKYAKADGELVNRWKGSLEGSIRHLNSCFAEEVKLYCANSNFPELPMASSIEVFSTDPLLHTHSLSLGIMDEGSLTWFDRLGNGWLAGFAHYDGQGGTSFKDHRFATIYRYDQRWRRLGGWMIPDSVTRQMQPYAASGGALGADGLLYLSGHDKPEVYVLAAPRMGPKLIHVATISLDIEGQAITWANSAERVLIGISRSSREIRTFQIPSVPLPDGLLRLTEVNFAL
ncbi:MAG: hypothetical protein CMD92_05010 [Gammaproteobacteria bacterium]|nr:hypothetical protein [Gammaproteobacteria bacterium]HBW84360.1 hypothetical protein [Gammaproteobacteria bacterium]|tara:strand:+ start:212 stop:1105 length:894 start_codon:yes stop_codon:yes gene_type:complete